MHQFAKDMKIEIGCNGQEQYCEDLFVTMKKNFIEFFFMIDETHQNRLLAAINK